MQKAIAEKTSVIQQLQKQLADAERDKHTEIVKLRLEVTGCKSKYPAWLKWLPCV